MASLVTIFGGSGFVGRYIAQRMARAGWRVRVAVRRPEEAGFVRPYGTPGQVEPVLANIREPSSIRKALEGADAAVNCVGILNEVGRSTFGLIQQHGAAHVAEVAAEMGLKRLVHISAIGADPHSDSGYSASKGLGEQAVLKAFPEAVILRPSVIFGPEDQFFNRFAGMARLGPVLPVVGAGTLFQPVYVDDVAAAAEKALKGEAAPGIYELGGPEAKRFDALMRDMLEIIHREKVVVLGLPRPIAAVMGGVLDVAQRLSQELFVNTVLTRDQVRNLGRDNVVGEDAKGLADLGITPTAMASVLPEYLWRFRPAGQFDGARDAVSGGR